MNRMKIVVPRASWSDVFSDRGDNRVIRGHLRSAKSKKGPAEMHLPCLSFLSKEWGEVQFSRKAPDYESENVEIREAIGKVSGKTRRRGIWVMDRGGDHGYLYRYLLHENSRFIIRIRSDRSLITTRKVSALETGESCPMLFHEYIAREGEKEEKPLKLEVGYRRVWLPDHSQELGLVVMKGFGREPMMLLTNLKLRQSRKSIWHVVQAYLTRWRIEETIRYMKQSYQLEDIRVRKYCRLQNMIAILMAVM